MKPTANHAVIEQTPNTRGGYLIAFVAGLLTYPSLPRLPSPMTSGKHIQLQNIIANISLKALSKDSLNLGMCISLSNAEGF